MSRYFLVLVLVSIIWLAGCHSNLLYYYDAAPVDQGEAYCIVEEPTTEAVTQALTLNFVKSGLTAVEYTEIVFEQYDRSVLLADFYGSEPREIDLVYIVHVKFVKDKNDKRR